MLEPLPGRCCTKLKSKVSASARLPLRVFLLLLFALLLCTGFAPASAAPVDPPDSAIAENSQAPGTALDSTSRTAAADSMVQRLSRTDDGRVPRPLDLPYQQPESVFSVKNISMVMIVIGLLVLFLHLLRKFLLKPLGGGVSGGQFQVIRQFHLGPKKSVTLVRFADRLLLLGVTDSTISTLAEIDDPDEVERIVKETAGASGVQGGGFKDIYHNLLSRGKKNA